MAVNRCTAVFAGEGRIRLDLDLDLREGLTTTEIESVLDRTEGAVKAAVPAVHAFQVDLNSPPEAEPDAHR